MTTVDPLTHYCTPAQVPNVPMEAVCTCRHLIADHIGYFRTVERFGFPPEERFHRAGCQFTACSCRYYIHGEFRGKR